MRIINQETNKVITEWDYPTVEIDGNTYNKKIKDADGNLMMAGGIPTLNNFKPTAAAWLIHVSPRAHAAGAGKIFRLLPPWGWALIALAITAMAAALPLLSRRKKRNPAEDDTPAVVVEEPANIPDTRMSLSYNTTRMTTTIMPAAKTHDSRFFVFFMFVSLQKVYG